MEWNWHFWHHFPRIVPYLIATHHNSNTSWNFLRFVQKTKCLPFASTSSPLCFSCSLSRKTQLFQYSLDFCIVINTQALIWRWVFLCATRNTWTARKSRLERPMRCLPHPTKSPNHFTNQMCLCMNLWEWTIFLGKLDQDRTGQTLQTSMQVSGVYTWMQKVCLKPRVQTRKRGFSTLSHCFQRRFSWSRRKNIISPKQRRRSPFWTQEIFSYFCNFTTSSFPRNKHEDHPSERLA